MPRKKKPHIEPVPDVYPNLSSAVSILETRIQHISKERHPLLQKWIANLNKIQSEIVHLQKLEKFTTALNPKEKENDNIT